MAMRTRVWKSRRMEAAPSRWVCFYTACWPVIALSMLVRHLAQVLLQLASHLQHLQLAKYPCNLLSTANGHHNLSKAQEYQPAKLDFGKPHPDPVVETASLASVEPPDITYQLHLDDLVASGGLSALQLESIVYACQRHGQVLH